MAGVDTLTLSAIAEASGLPIDAVKEQAQLLGISVTRRAQVLTLEEAATVVTVLLSVVTAQEKVRSAHLDTMRTLERPLLVEAEASGSDAAVKKATTATRRRKTAFRAWHATDRQREALQRLSGQIARESARASTPVQVGDNTTDLRHTARDISLREVQPSIVKFRGSGEPGFVVKDYMRAFRIRLPRFVHLVEDSGQCHLPEGADTWLPVSEALVLKGILRQAGVSQKPGFEVSLRQLDELAQAEAFNRDLEVDAKLEQELVGALANLDDWDTEALEPPSTGDGARAKTGKLESDQTAWPAGSTVDRTAGPHERSVDAHPDPNASVTYLHHEGQGKQGDEVREILDLIQSGEGQDLEFKSSFAFDRETRQKNPKLQYAVVRTIVAFANTTKGGSILVGVSDDGKVEGIEDDYRLLGRAKRDASDPRDRLKLYIGHVLDRETVGLIRDLHIEMLIVPVPANNGQGSLHLLRVKVKPADRPVYANPPKGDRNQNERYYVRQGSEILDLTGSKMSDHIWAKQRAMVERN